MNVTKASYLSLKECQISPYSTYTPCCFLHKSCFLSTEMKCDQIGNSIRLQIFNIWFCRWGFNFDHYYAITMYRDRRFRRCLNGLRRRINVRSPFRCSRTVARAHRGTSLQTGDRGNVSAISRIFFSCTVQMQIRVCMSMALEWVKLFTTVVLNFFFHLWANFGIEGTCADPLHCRIILQVNETMRVILKKVS